MIIGLIGPIGAGKDEIAAYLVERHRFERLAFGDALKDDVCRRFTRTLLAVLMHSSSLWSQYAGWIQKQGLAVSDETKLHWLVRIRKPPIVRELLQEYGTEVRRADDPRYWVNRLHERREASLNALVEVPRRDERLVIPDVRFPNEADYVRAHHGYLWRVNRAGTSFGSDKHESEHGLPDEAVHETLINPGTDVPSLHAQVERVLADLSP